MTLEISLYSEVKLLLETARSSVYKTVNITMVICYWNIGKTIVEKQGGANKAEYGDKLIVNLAKELTKDFGKGFSTTNLKYMRQFYMLFPINQTLSSESQISQTLSDQLEGKSTNGQLQIDLANRFRLTWSHYCHLLRIENPLARQYYEEEAIKGNWSVRQLQRQISTLYYERLLASREKKSVVAEMQSLTLSPARPEDIIRDPYILDFIGIKENTKFLERDIEQALISHLQEFLLELGNGFSFVARQKRITFDNKHFYIDLVFYNYVLKCFVIIDLKLGELTHQDLGQMQMYVNYYERELLNEGDNPPIGIVLCADKNESVVKYTLPENQNQIFASKYKLYLPSEEELKAELDKELSVLGDDFI